MRLIFYNPDSPKSNNKCPYKRKVKEDLRQTEEKIQRGGDVKKRCKIGVISYKECQQPPEPEEARNRLSPKASGGSMDLPVICDNWLQQPWET